MFISLARKVLTQLPVDYVGFYQKELARLLYLNTFAGSLVLWWPVILQTLVILIRANISETHAMLFLMYLASVIPLLFVHAHAIANLEIFYAGVYHNLATIIFEMVVVVGTLMVIGWNYLIFSRFHLENQVLLSLYALLSWICHMVSLVCHLNLTSRAKAATGRVANAFTSTELCFGISALIQTFYFVGRLDSLPMIIITIVLLLISRTQLKDNDFLTPVGIMGTFVGGIGLVFLLLNYCMDLKCQMTLCQLLFVAITLPLFVMNVTFGLAKHFDSVYRHFEAVHKHRNPLDKEMLSQQNDFLLVCVFVVIMWIATCSQVTILDNI